MTNTYPQLAVKGVGYDRLLGGLEIDIRLRDHLAKNFEVCEWMLVLALSRLLSVSLPLPSLSPSPLSPLPPSSQSLKKTQGSVYESPRAMAKLLKEAKRVKQVLSANIDHFAQVRSLLKSSFIHCTLY